jgi:hypothetical protein
MKKVIRIVTFTLLTFVANISFAQIDSDHFSKLLGTEPTVEINLGTGMLGLLSSALQGEEEGIALILSSLTAINVTVFNLDDKNSSKDKEGNNSRILSIRNEIKGMAKHKMASGFEKLATIKEEDSLVYIFAKMNDKKFKNLSIFALDDENELVLIDISGDILLSQIGKLMEHFDVDLDINGLELGKQGGKDQ